MLPVLLRMGSADVPSAPADIGEGLSGLSGTSGLSGGFGSLAFLAFLVPLSACTIRERVRVEYRTLPPQVIERHLMVPVIPVQVESSPAPSSPSTQPAPSLSPDYA